MKCGRSGRREAGRRQQGADTRASRKLHARTHTTYFVPLLFSTRTCDCRAVSSRHGRQICTSFKNIEDVWNFQLSDVMIEMNFPVFMTASKQPEPAIGVSQPKTNYVRVADTSRFYVRDLKLTTADHRLFLSLEKGKQALGRAPKKPRTDAGG